MSFDDVISSGKDFAKALTKFSKSRAMIYTTICGSFGAGTFGYNKVMNHIDIIESTPAYRNSNDSTLKVVNKKMRALDSINQLNTIAVDSLEIKNARNNQIEYRVNENMDLIDMMYVDMYDYIYKTDARIKHLEEITH